MRYLLIMCDDAPEGEPPAEIMAELAGWVDTIEGRGVRHLGARLRPASEATSVRVRDDTVLVTDGPFAETAEQIGGFELVDCDTMADAVRVAAAHPNAGRWAVEVRPLRDE